MPAEDLILYSNLKLTHTQLHITQMVVQYMPLTKL